MTAHKSLSNVVVISYMSYNIDMYNNNYKNNNHIVVMKMSVTYYIFDVSVPL